MDAAHAKGIYVLFDGVFGHHKGALETSPTGKLPVDSTNAADYGGNPQNYPGRVVDYTAQASVDFYKEVATYWIDQLGIDGWRLDQGYQVPTAAWQDIKAAVDAASAQRALAGEEWGTLGYMVSEIFSGNANYIASVAYGSDANPVLDSAFDFPVRYATVGVLAGEESGLSGRPASTLGDSWSYGAHDQTYPDHALPNLMLGNHDLVRYGDLLQRADIADPTDAEYWVRHRLAFMVQGAYSGPITRYYGEEIGDEVPNYADQVTAGCANQGLCDDHVARTSAKILDVTVTAGQLSTEQHNLMQFHQELMTLRSQYPALSHGTRQHLYSDNNLYVDLKTLDNQEIVFAMNVSDQPISVQLNDNLFTSMPPNAWDLLNEVPVVFSSGYLTFTLAPLSGQYILLADGPDLFPVLGDMNQDGDVTTADAPLLVEALVDPATYAARLLPFSATEVGDLNQDGTFDLGDIAEFSAQFGASAGADAAPEPTSLSFATLLLMVLAVVRWRR